VLAVLPGAGATARGAEVVPVSHAEALLFWVALLMLAYLWAGMYVAVR